MSEPKRLAVCAALLILIVSFGQLFWAPLLSGQSSNGNKNSSQIQACGATSSCSHTALTHAQTVWGTVPLVTGTPSTVTISGISPAFSSTSSYKCLLQDQTTQTNNTAISVTSYASGSSFVITGPSTNTDTILYVCVGN